MVVSKAKRNVEKLVAMPVVVALAKHIIEEHAPHTPTLEDVVLPRVAFDALCLTALVGLDACDDFLDSRPGAGVGTDT
jgi:hypothetical protein